MLADENARISVFSTVRRLREERFGMVQTLVRTFFTFLL